ncbi:MAG: hypothetical protein JW776_01195 [Candidatus Lokiarchaeota archaeon]|nr:hypothetical protein [Candidatus Lokiarchaeota archaeon]
MVVLFKERLTSVGALFIIYGLLSFFGLNNYCPYSYFYLRLEIGFFQPKIVWFVFVLITNIFLIIICLRLYRIGKETNDNGFSRFTMIYLISGFTIVLFVIVNLIYSFFPVEFLEEEFVKITATAGMIYSVLLILAYLIQNIAWIGLYKYYKTVDNNVTKILRIEFGGIPIIIVIGNLIAIISSIIGFIGGIFILRELLPTSYPAAFMQFDMAAWATYSSFGWILLNMIGYTVLGLRIINKPSLKTEKPLVSQRRDVKIAKQSCPICRNTIYEGQNICSNCGYRFR